LSAFPNTKVEPMVNVGLIVVTKGVPQINVLVLVVIQIEHFVIDKTAIATVGNTSITKI
jgi:hypothetical protein